MKGSQNFIEYMPNFIKCHNNKFWISVKKSHLELFNLPDSGSTKAPLMYTIWMLFSALRKHSDTSNLSLLTTGCVMSMVTDSDVADVSRPTKSHAAEKTYKI